MRFTENAYFCKMNQQDTITDFAALGQRMAAYLDDPHTCPALMVAERETLAANTWFTPEGIHRALAAIAADRLEAKKLQSWLAHYPANGRGQKIAVVMAGNIPLVGFHDFLCVLASGHSFLGKLSHKDPFLLPALAAMLTDIRPEWRHRMAFTTDRQLPPSEALIVTGSDQTAHYFAQQIAGSPHRPCRALIRRSRSSVAILTGTEPADALTGLADDILSYFGLGCRNVSMLYVPEGYDWQPLTSALAVRDDAARHTGYRHNYRYRKALLSVQQKPFIDASTVLLCETPSLQAPPAVVHFQYYRKKSDVLDALVQQGDRLQCIVAGDRPNRSMNNKFCTFGTAQRPQLLDYADGIDTMRWLMNEE
jgi:hypothetical protein